MKVTDEYAGLGPKLPDIEDARETINTVARTLNDVLNSDKGLQVGKRVRISGESKILATITVPAVSGAVPPEIHIELDKPLPRVNLAGWLKGDITGVKITETAVHVLIDGLPDVEIKVIS